MIGAGVIGLAIARRLAGDGREVFVVEAEDTWGTGTSSRNSEVIHAGLYYPTDTLRARLCVSGNRRLYEYCRDRSVGHARVGKLVVATRATDRTQLEALEAQSHANGVHDVRLLSGAEARTLEPNVTCRWALSSPSSGIIDSHGLMSALYADAVRAGAVFAFRSPVIGAEVGLSGAVSVEVGGRDPMTVRPGAVINAAGLGAWAVARAFRSVPQPFVPPRYMAKGTYFSLPGPSPFRGLVYPLPGPASLGVHSTVDLAGQARFGPDLEWVESIDYGVDQRRAAALYEEIREWYPALQAGSLTANYSGIRPKTHGPGEPQPDWCIQTAAEHGVKGLVHLLGMESPGLTACLALADYVVDDCVKRFSSLGRGAASEVT